VDKRFEVFILLALSLYFIVSGLPGSINVGGGWWNCLDYLEDGVLYGGQPYCAQAPLIYIIGYFYRIFVNNASMLYFFWFITLYSTFMTFLVFRRILIRENVYDFFSYSLVFILFVLRFIDKTEVCLSVMFFFIGVYLLIYCRRGFLAGLLFSLSIFMKYISLYPVLIMLVFYVYRYREFKTVLSSIFVICLSFILLLFIFPNFFVYSFLALKDHIRFGLFEGLALLFRDKYVYDFVFVLFLFLSAFFVKKVWFNKSNSIFLFGASTLLFHSVLFIRSKGVSWIGSSYNLPGFIFLIGFLMVVRRNSVKLFVLLSFLLLVFPSIFFIDDSPVLRLSRFDYYSYKEKSELLVSSPMNMLSRVDGPVLFEVPLASSKPVFESLGGSDVLFFGMPGLSVPEDGEFGVRIRERVASEYPAFNSLPLTKLELFTQNRLLDGYYSLVVVSPESQSQLGRIINPVLSEVNSKFCVVSVPSFVYQGFGRDRFEVLFLDYELCESFLLGMVLVYDDVFKELCLFNPVAARVVSSVLLDVGVVVGDVCLGESRFIFSVRESVLFRDLVLLLIGLLIFLCSSYR